MQLYRVLHAHTVANPEQNYCQGINVIAAVLLFYMPEEEAFFCFNAIMRRRRLIYLDRLQGAQRENKVLECLLHKLFPQIESHFHKHDVPISYAAI